MTKQTQGVIDGQEFRLEVDGSEELMAQIEAKLSELKGEMEG
jgi:hypothetical protein